MNIDVQHGQPRNSMLARAAGAFVRSLEFLSLRGGPTIFNALWRFPPLRQTMATARLASGQTIAFRAFDAYWCRHVWANAPYEQDVEQIFRKIGRGRVLVDCGANIGFWSIRGPEFGFTEVIAIEANRDLIPILRENFRLNRVPGIVHHAAVYSSSGEALFLDHTEAHAVAGIGERGMPVTSMTIADAVEHVSRTQEIVAKLDVEGAEIPALAGAEGVENIIFVYEDFLKNDMVVSRHLLEQGFALFGVTSKGRQSRICSVHDALAFSSANAPRNGPANLVACRPNKAAKLQDELSVGQ